MTFLGNQPTAVPLNANDLLDGIISEAKLADDAVSLAKMKAGVDGTIISFDASTNPVAIATGNDGMVLTSSGAGNPCAFEVLPSATTFAQAPVIHHQTGGGGSLTDSSTNQKRYNGLTVDISPTSSSNKILVYFQQQQRIHQGGGGNQNFDAIHNHLQRGNSSTTIGSIASLISGFGGTVTQIWNQDYNMWTNTTSQKETTILSYWYLDSPATTNLVRYFSSISNTGKGEDVRWKVDAGTAQMYAMEIKL